MFSLSLSCIRYRLRSSSFFLSRSVFYSSSAVPARVRVDTLCVRLKPPKRIVHVGWSDEEEEDGIERTRQCDQNKWPLSVFLFPLFFVFFSLAFALVASANNLIG